MKNFPLMERFKAYNRSEVILKVLSMMIGVSYVIYSYVFETGLGVMVPRYAGY